MINISSKEFLLLIELIKQHVSGKQEVLTINDIQWNEFMRLSGYHGMRHLVYANQHLLESIPIKTKERLELFSMKRAISKLENQLEVKALFDLFEKQKLHPLLIKGTAFPFYTGNHQLNRESTDVDLVFPKTEIPKVALLLLNRGYAIRNMGKLDQIQNLEQELEQFVQNSFFQEIHFDKQPYNIDVHWDLCNSYLPYKFPITKLYEDTILINYYGKELRSISIENFFWTLLIHHGGKEYWLKMKDLVDFMMFLKVHQNHLNWQDIIIKAKEFQLLTLFKNGLWFIKHLFDFPLEQRLENCIKNYTPRTENYTLHFWQKGKYWNQAIPRFQFEWILIHSQDTSFRWWNYAYQFYLAYKEPNPFEWNRIFNFPRGFGFLNFLDKFLAWVIRR